MYKSSLCTRKYVSGEFMFDTSLIIIRQYFCWYRKCVCSWANGTNREWFSVVFTLLHTHTFINIGIDIKYWHFSHTKLLIKRTIKWMILHKMNMNTAPMLVFSCNLDGFDTIFLFLWAYTVVNINHSCWYLSCRVTHSCTFDTTVSSLETAEVTSEQFIRIQSFPSIFPFASSKDTSNFIPTQGSRSVCMSVFRQLLGLLDQTH